VEIAACCDVRREAAETFAATFGSARTYTDLEVMIREEELDAILLATWPIQHREQLELCLDAGIRSILCEKSLAPSSDDCLAVWSKARELDALVVEGFMWRHHPAVRKLDEMIEAGELGKLDYVRAQFDFYIEEVASADDPNRNWRQRPEAAGGVPWDVTCYCVDACNRFAGALPIRVSAVVATSEKYGTVDRLHGFVEYENGVVATVASSLRTNFNYELEVNGSDAVVVVPCAWRIDGPSTLNVRRSTGLFAWNEEQLPVVEADPYQQQLERFADCARGGATSEPTLEQSVINAFVVEALVTSGRERAAIDVELPTELREAALV
jgi:predicted dehydrogenase